MCIKINKIGKQESRNLMGPKTLPTIWYTYMTLVTKYQISAINSYSEKCAEKYLGRTEVKQYTPVPLRGARYKNCDVKFCIIMPVSQYDSIEGERNPIIMQSYKNVIPY